MRHPTEGTLRRLLDEPVGVADPDREHVADCPVCLAGLAAAQEDAAAVRSAVDLPVDLERGLDLDAAWQRLSQAAAADAPSTVVPLPPRRRLRGALRSPAVAAAGVVALVAGASAAAAADWLQVFRTERLEAVTITQADLVQLPDLTAYGTVEVVAEPEVRVVADAETAEQASGLEVLDVPDLPRGVDDRSTLSVGSQLRAEFTFSAEQAARAADEAGEELPPPPTGLDGSRFRLVAGPGVAQVWSADSGLPGLVVARAVAPTAFSSGVPFDAARDYLLSLPGMPEEVATQLRGYSADGTTLPLPVPADEATSSEADVGGAPATVLESRDGAFTAVVWVDDGVVTAVAGSLRTDEVLSVARDLR
jgi:hypothetical protein